MININDKEQCSETACPFNDRWCVEKQNCLDQWRKAIRIYGQSLIADGLILCKNSFDRCPKGCVALCSEYRQRQRG